ncbi:hypothetical protein [Acidiphilium acidophilum]|uniref:hypothetical protein n=1 Tax=Acidiphilium acidophilum TaxID=76588 RepID=UPI002E8E7843|nr:hypothetical protein [Acidiphilium acidophilum]
MNSDTLTILRSRGRRLAKLIRADGEIDGYDEAKTFTAIEHDVENLDDLHRALTWLATRPDRCIVRAALINSDRTTPMRRLLYADQETGDAATLYEPLRFWLATDWDALDQPEGLDLADLAECGRVALARLPAAFHNAACIVSATASHGLKPGIRIRLWHWLDRAINQSEIRRWLGAIAGLDDCIFRPAQVIYTAAPVFETGIDHLAARTARIDGEPRVAVPSAAALAPPAPRPAAPLPKPSDARASTYAYVALRNAAARVATAGKGDRHFTIIREARSLARFIDAGLLTTSDVRATLEQSAQSAGKPEGEADAVIAWAIAHPSQSPLMEVCNGR